jgi:conjugative relaxase-like TrwC/TraI family protein
MMSMSEALSPAQTEHYFDEHYSQDEYYTQGQRCVGLWIGQGAAELGLAGDVSREDFSTLLQGINPRSGAVLIPASTHNGEHRAGWDSVFSAPKSVSIQALIGGDGRLLPAHARAVERALIEVEAYAMARQHGGREYIVTSNVVGAAFNHLAARPVDSVRLPDPQLHTHVVLLNMTRRPDGEWRSMDPVHIYGAQRLGSAVYRSELAREVQRLGYRIQVTAGDGAWELEGFTREQVMAFSNRRQDIQRRMVEQGLSGPKAAQIVALSSRQAKRDYDEAKLKADWQKRAREMGIDARQHFWEALGRGDMRNGNAVDAETALDFAKAHTTNRQAVVDRRELEAAALQHCMGQVNLDAVREQIGVQEQALMLIRAGRPSPEHPQGAYTTDEMLALERENLALVRAGRGQAKPIAGMDEIERWSVAKGLYPDQTAAAKLMLSSNDWVTAIEGLAGSTKTTTVGAIREFAEEQGYIVRGFGMTSGSVKALREAGVSAQTVASLLGNPLPSPSGPELWFVDESSLVATSKANELLKAARELGVARIVFVGDQRQHHAIEAGAPVWQFLADNMAVAKLNVIRRQRDPELRRAVAAAPERPREAFELLQQQGRISEIPDLKQRYRRIAADYLDGHEAGQTTLVVSPGNDERRALNQEIRNLLVANGHVEKQGREHRILVRRDLTPAQITHAGSYQERDVVHFLGTRHQQRQGLGKDSYLTVEAVNRSGNSLTLRTGAGRRIEASPAKWAKAAEVYTQEARTLAVGDRLQFRTPDKRHDIANGQFATVLDLHAKQAKLRFDSKREVALPLSELRHVDYGYASTSHAAQGATVDQVIVNADSMRSAQLVNRKQFYVSISRARNDARVYTDDTQALRRAVVREPKKAIALDAVKQRPTQELKPTPETSDLQPQQSQTQSLGIRI